MDSRALEQYKMCNISKENLGKLPQYDSIVANALHFVEILHALPYIFLDTFLTQFYRKDSDEMVTFTLLANW